MLGVNEGLGGDTWPFVKFGEPSSDARPPFLLPVRSVPEPFREAAMSVNQKALHAWLLGFQLDTLIEHVNLLDRTMSREKAEFNSRLAARVAGLPPAERDEVIDWHSDEGIHLADVYPRFVWQSVLVSIWAFVEHELTSLCKLDLRFNDEKIPPAPETVAREYEIQYARHAINYFTERGVAFPESGAKWQELDMLRLIRNQIVHNHGRLRAQVGEDMASKVGTPKGKTAKALAKVQQAAADQKSIVEYIRKRQGGGLRTLSLSGDDLTITPDYCRECIATIRAFFEELCPLLP